MCTKIYTTCMCPIKERVDCTTVQNSVVLVHIYIFTCFSISRHIVVHNRIASSRPSGSARPCTYGGRLAWHITVDATSCMHITSIRWCTCAFCPRVLPKSSSKHVCMNEKGFHFIKMFGQGHFRCCLKKLLRTSQPGYSWSSILVSRLINLRCECGIFVNFFARSWEARAIYLYLSMETWEYSFGKIQEKNEKN